MKCGVRSALGDAAPWQSHGGVAAQLRRWPAENVLGLCLPPTLSGYKGSGRASCPGSWSGVPCAPPQQGWWACVIVPPAPRLLRLPGSGQENHRASHASAGASFCSEIGNLKCFKIKTNSGLLYNSVKTLHKNVGMNKLKRLVCCRLESCGSGRDLLPACPLPSSSALGGEARGMPVWEHPLTGTDSFSLIRTSV